MMNYEKLNFADGEVLTATKLNHMDEGIVNAANYQCNPNLLDNWYFGNPVNQRNGYVVPTGTAYYNPGETTVVGTTDKYYMVERFSGTTAAIFKIGSTEYSVPYAKAVPGYSLYGYGLDRWIGYDTSANAVLIKSDGISTAGTPVFQLIDNPSRLHNKTLTCSILLANGVLRSGTVKAGSANGGYWQSDAVSYIQDTDSDGIPDRFRIYSPTESIVAVKLELGSQQTLAHQENGVWVLNEIPDYGEQLRRCQRYFQKISCAGYDKPAFPCFWYGSVETGFRAEIFLPTVMRSEGGTTITINNKENIRIVYFLDSIASHSNVDEIRSTGVFGNTIHLNFIPTNTVSAYGISGWIDGYGVSATWDIFISKDL